jgi:predicted GNAT family acetyltransferase
MKHVKLFKQFTNGYEFTVKHIDDNEYAVIATKSGKQVGRLDFIKSKFKPALKASTVNVDPSYRRQGIATSMYQFAEQEFDLKFVRNDEVLTADGKSLWNSKNRKFGQIT